MTFFFYKCYYVFFLYYTNKDKSPWYSSITAMATSLCIFILSLFELVGFLDFFNSFIEDDSPSTRKGKTLLFLIIPLCTLIWYAVSFIVSRMGEASKIDGRSERYDFDPTKRDKTICWLACFLSLAFGLSVIGFKTLLGLK